MGLDPAQTKGLLKNAPPSLQALFLHGFPKCISKLEGLEKQSIFQSYAPCIKLMPDWRNP